MKKSFFLGAILSAALCLIFSSCEKSVSDVDQPEGEKSGQVYNVNIGFGGEYISSTEIPLTKALKNTSRKVYAINVYRKTPDAKSYSKYAYGLFDNVKALTIPLSDAYVYKFECAIVKEDRDTLYNKEGLYANPFKHNGIEDTELTNKFVFSTSQNFDGLKSGVTTIAADTDVDYPRMYRYYGETTEFVPAEGASIELQMKKMVFGLHFLVEPPTEGEMELSCFMTNFKVSSFDKPYDDEAVYTFYNIEKCFQDLNYSGNITLRLNWTKSDGTVEKEEKKIQIKRNTMTIIKIDVNGGAFSPSFRFEEETQPMDTVQVNWNV